MKNIDRRYVEILAKVVTSKYNKWIPRLGGLGFVILGFGTIVALTGNMGGVGIVVIGIIAIIIAVILANKDGKKIESKRVEFLTYFDEQGELPPFPNNEPEPGKKWVQ